MPTMRWEFVRWLFARVFISLLLKPLNNRILSLSEEHCLDSSLTKYDCTEAVSDYRDGLDLCSSGEFCYQERQQCCLSLP